MKPVMYVPQVPDENSTPPLGPFYLMAVLENADFEGRLFDVRIDGRAYKKLVAFGPAILVGSAVTFGHGGGLLAARKLKEAISGATVVFGRPSLSSLPAEVTSEFTFDLAVVG